MKYIKIPLLCLLLFAIATTIFADESIQLVYNYTDFDITVVFSNALNTSQERHQEIANEIAGVTLPMIADPNMDSPNNIICTLFGHNLSATTVSATHHKVRQYSPRCLVELYDVTVCSRCNYAETEFVSSSYIFCCPED